MFNCYFLKKVQNQHCDTSLQIQKTFIVFFLTGTCYHEVFINRVINIINSLTVAISYHEIL